MHTYKFIYMYAYILCTKRFVIIFVVIVWKTTLNTLEKLEIDYLRRLFEENHLRRIIWEKSFKRDHLRKIIWKRSFERDHLRKIIWERSFKKNHLRKIIWERSFERDHLRKIIWERSFERNHLREIIWERDSEKKIFDKKRRNEILRQTTRILRISMNKTRLFVHVWYLNFLNILFRFSLSNISFTLFLLKWFLSNDSSQMISLK
jgi:hypothetical protein